MRSVTVPVEQFQSSSSPKTGCKHSATCSDPELIRVSILIQPEDRMQAARATLCGVAEPVSILIQPEDRMQGTQRVLWERGVAVSILIQPEDRMQAG